MSEKLPIEIRTESKSHTELDISVRNHKFKIDEPKEFGGNDKASNPIEYLFAGLAGCLNVAAHQVAKEKGVSIDKLKIDVKGNLDLEGFLNKESSKRPGFQEIKVEFDIQTDSNEETENQILKEAEKRCPISDNIQHKTLIKIERRSTK